MNRTRKAIAVVFGALLTLDGVKAQLVQPTAEYGAGQSTVAGAKAASIGKALAPLLTLVEMISFGTTASSEQLRDGLQGTVGRGEWDFRKQQTDCLMFFSARLSDATYAVHVTPPISVSQSGQFVRIDGQSGRSIETQRDGSNELITRGRLLLKFSFPDDAAKVTTLFAEFAKCGEM
jgi:hypothetical protein